MTESIFYILVTIKTGTGPQNIGRFQLGDNPSVAAELFNRLKGEPALNDGVFLTMELMETKNNLPVNLKIKTCSLEEMGYNCKLIAIETFKIANLGAV